MLLAYCEQAQVDFSWIKVVLAATASALILLLAAARNATGEVTSSACNRRILVPLSRHKQPSLSRARVELGKKELLIL